MLFAKMPVAPPRKPAGVKKGWVPSTGTLQCGAGVLIIAIIIGLSQYFSPPSEEAAAAPEKLPNKKTIAKAVSPLTDENFAEYVATMHPGGALIDFYSQSCKFCTKLAPEFEKAAYLSSQDKEGAVPFASVDQETGRVIMETFGIERFPTVLWFWKGKNVMELPRASEKPAAEILKWAKWAATPAVQELDTNEELEGALPTLRTSMHKNARLIVAFNREGSESMRGAFEEAAQRHRSTTVFLYIKEASDKKPIMSYAGEDSKDEFYEGSANATEVVQWVKATLEAAKPPKEEAKEEESSTQKALNALKGTVASEAEE